MASDDYHVMATIKVKPGKIGNVAKLIVDLVLRVYENEPDTLLYHCVQTGEDEIVNKQAFHKHGQTLYFTEFVKAIYPLSDGDMDLKVGKSIAGFQGRPQLLA
ncbi:hypothetical protein F5884DRAFT_687409 [Xylogone sp. PMI_703]|nr:hypothetical protein F5884DRAFT_687409 [Xylogone sp. PMI_703]